MYPHYHHQPLDSGNNVMPGSMYHQPPPPRQQYPHHPHAHHPMAPAAQQQQQHPIVPSQAAAVASAAAAVRHPVYQQQQQQQQPPQPPPPEPLPSATDIHQTLQLTIPQMAEFASSMVYLMWHARRPSVMALHSASKIADGSNHAEQDAMQSRETANIANATSSAFKKFSRQVLEKEGVLKVDERDKRLVT
ncbi:hypothetical protein BDB00DRAFT_859685 [Zychaea mexicana]|uniref:uncharacterized protein n=1 Tax=Zychaea mexicana TaxID=64656 RepID=UPI0022FE93E1|nr:uncharacterized protein BDB00DRAFT_859685 [Zychaea mexicana]KAI9477066.1 hypothetical protein BDB00DRAFT_859685 [Zychaea mexicana]